MNQLPDFKLHPELNILRKKMRAPYLHVFEENWVPRDLRSLLEELLTKRDLEITFDQIATSGSGAFKIANQDVVLYIKKQRSGGKYKYHLCDCPTLKSARTSQKYKKYVASINNSGVFHIDIKRGEDIDYHQKKKLEVCRNCLYQLNYKGYKEYSSKRNRIYNNFDLSNYLGFNQKTTYPKKSKPLKKKLEDSLFRAKKINSSKLDEIRSQIESGNVLKALLSLRRSLQGFEIDEFSKKDFEGEISLHIRTWNYLDKQDRTKLLTKEEVLVQGNQICERIIRTLTDLREKVDHKST